MIFHYYWKMLCHEIKLEGITSFMDKFHEKLVVKIRQILYNNVLAYQVWGMSLCQGQLLWSVGVQSIYGIHPLTSPPPLNNGPQPS